MKKAKHTLSPSKHLCNNANCPEVIEIGTGSKEGHFSLLFFFGRISKIGLKCRKNWFRIVLRFFRIICRKTVRISARRAVNRRGRVQTNTQEERPKLDNKVKNRLNEKYGGWNYGRLMTLHKCGTFHFLWGDDSWGFTFIADDFTHIHLCIKVMIPNRITRCYNWIVSRKIEYSVISSLLSFIHFFPYRTNTSVFDKTMEKRKM